MLQSLKREEGFYRRLWRLSLPMILQFLITFSLGLIDTFMVSQLGNEEMAAVTTANVPVFLIMSIVFGVQSGLGILVSQYWGKKDTVSISRAMGVACLFGVGLALLLALVFFAFPIPVMDLLSNNHHLSELGAPYLRIIGFSYLFNMVASIYVSVQRSVGNPSFGLKLFGFSTILNTVLNYFLIFGKLGLPALGITGAALATLCARMAECIISLICVTRDRRVTVDWAAFLRPGADMVRRFIKYSTPVLLNEIGWGAGNSLLTVVLGHTVDSVAFLSAYSVTGNLGRLFLVVCFGLGAATAVMVGNAIGEGKSREDVMSLSQCLLNFTFVVGMGLALVSTALVPLLFQPVIFPIFKLYGEVARIATSLAVTAFLAIPLHAYTISAVTGVLRSGGDVGWAAALDLLPQWCFGLLLTALFALVFKWGCWPIAIAMQGESILKMPLCYLRCRKPDWIHDVTIPEALE